MNDSMITQFVLAYLGTRAIEWAKKAGGLPWITASTDKINKTVGAAVAFLATLGIGLATSWESSTGTFTLTVSGLTTASLATFVWHWLTQFVLQQAAYHGLVKTPPEVK
jgi:hypothetical protein